MWKTVLSLIIVNLVLSAQAQMPGGGRPGGAGAMGAQMNVGRFYGKVLDDTTGKPVEGASVQLTVSQFNEKTKKRKDSTVAGQFTLANGDFSLEGLAVMGQYKLIISAVGYKTIELKQSFDMGAMMSGGGDMTKMMNAADKDLGNLKLVRNAKELDEVKVNTVRRAYETSIDRKTFIVDRNSTTTGGTGLDVMKNIPSVTVDVDGNVQMRNSNPQIFVDGRPTTLTLDQIPAETIDKVELITNPSAKFDASGVGGIINVVLKKNIRKGYNGFLNAGIGTYDRYNVVFSFNYRQGKFNFFTNVGYNYQGNRTEGYTRRENLKGGNTTGFYNVDQTSFSFGGFVFARAGFDFYADNRNTITASFALSRGGFDTRDIQNQSFLYSNKNIESTGSRISTGVNEFRGNTSQLSYKHTFEKPGREYTADVTYTKGGSDNDGDFTNTLKPLGGIAQSYFQRNDGGGETEQLTVQTDYVHPITDRAKIEGGLRTNWNWFSSPFVSYVALPNGTLVKNDFLSNSYSYKQGINAAYVNFSTKTKNDKFGFQFGLRAEQSTFSGKLTQFNARSQTNPNIPKDTTLGISIDVPNSNGSFMDMLFPSVYLSYFINDKNEVQLNYSRRIQRPNFFQLIPFTDFSDLQNLRQGNGSLKPEYTSSFDLNYNRKLTKGNLSIGSYYRFTNDPIIRFSVPYSKQTGAVVPNSPIFDTNTVVVNTFINAQNENFLGAEFTLQYDISSKLSITPNANIFYSKVNANYLGIDQSNEGWQWLGKLNTSLKLGKNWSMQLNSSYNGPRVNPQGRSIDVFFMDFAVKKDFLKNNAGSLTLAITDIFDQRGFGGTTNTPTWNQDFFRRREARFARITFNFRFGKFDAQLFKRKNMKSERELMQGGQGGQGDGN